MNEWQLWRIKYLGERWWPIWSQRHAPRSVRPHCKHHPSLCCHCFLLKLTYRWERKSKRTGRRCIWAPEHCGCCCPGCTLPHSYIKGRGLGSRKISACCTLPAVFKKQMCRTKQWQGQWGNWRECCTSVLGKHIEEEGENHWGWSLHCGSRAQTGHPQASWENSPKSLVYSFSWSHVTQFVDIVCIREWTGGQPSLRICFPFQMLKKPKWELHRRATPEGCIATAAGARAEEGAAEKYGCAISRGYGLKSVLGPYCEIVLVCQKLLIQRIPIAVDHRTLRRVARQHTYWARLLLVSVCLLCITWKGLSTNWVQAGGLCCQLVTTWAIL